MTGFKVGDRVVIEVLGEEGVVVEHRPRNRRGARLLVDKQDGSSPAWWYSSSLRHNDRREAV